MFLLFHIAWAPARAQQTDSLLKLLSVAPEDTNKVMLYIQVGRAYEDRETEKAKQYYRMAGELSRKLNYPLGIIKYIANYTYILNNMDANFDSSILLNLEAVAISRKIKDSLYLAKMLFNTGNAYREKGDYEPAQQYYEEGKNIFQKLGDEATEAQGNDMLQLLYFQMHQYEKGIAYGIKAVEGSRKTEQTEWLESALSNLGLNYSAVHRFDKAEQVYQEALALAEKTNNTYVALTQYLNLGDLLLQQGKYQQLFYYCNKALPLARQLGSYASELIALRGIGCYWLSNRQYEQARLYGDSALRMSYRYNLRPERQKTFTFLANLSFASQDIKAGEAYGAQSTLLGDSLLNETMEKRMLDLEKKYELARKESHIQQLEAEKQVHQLAMRQKNTLNTALTITAILLLLIGALLYLAYRNKQKLQQQRINELETENQLVATEAILQGEEQERTRLAKDLHDGLGGMLSGIKYSLNGMRENLVMTNENQLAFARSLDMLDSSINEMRRVAHNMMPEALVKFGLDDALRDFASDINSTGALQVNYQSYNLETAPLKQTVAIAVYRIIQELTGNALKHAGATVLMIQVIHADSRVSITVEDDGAGFDTALLAKSKGIGLAGIRNRITFLRGTMDLHSTPGKGTSVNIEINDVV